MNSSTLKITVNRKPVFTQGRLGVVLGVLGSVAYYNFMQMRFDNSGEKEAWVKEQLEKGDTYCLANKECR
jgi:hypothetical protein